MSATRLAEVLQKIVNLSNHPLFHAQTELPVWDTVIGDAQEVLWEVTCKTCYGISPELGKEGECGNCFLERYR